MRSCPTNRGAGTRDEPLRTSAWEAITQLATTWQVWSFMGGKTRNIVIQLVLQEVAKQVARFCCPFYSSFRSRFFGISSKPRTSRDLVTKAMPSGLRFEFCFCMARPHSRGKWFTARVSAPQTSQSQVWEEILLFRTLLLINQTSPANLKSQTSIGKRVRSEGLWESLYNGQTSIF